ncbi:MAG TPA: cytochrome c biogenesis protein CcsA [Verrucomicrobiae bacterium]|nr:cytochrome c biogenesis protein CcsA [Verrucomicrobiae bacterium]
MKPLLLASAALYLFGTSRRPLFFAAVAAEVVYLATRGIAAGRLPLIGPHDTMVFFSTSIGVMSVPFLLSPAVRDSAVFRFSCAVAAALFALLSLPFPALNMPLPPVLDTLWFEAHVALAFFAYALFAVGAVAGGMFLARRERPLLDLQYRGALVGYTFFSLSMITGGIWGYYAWGTYWLWTPKELWTSILWLFYTLYLHLRLKGPTWERVVAWGGIAGFAVAMFTYLGVSMLMKSSHSF